MKNIKLLAGFLYCLSILSCKKDFLDSTKPEDKITSADVWKSPELAQKVINGAYFALPPGHTYFLMMSATDEGMFQYNDLPTPFTHGLVTANTLGCFGQGNWAVGESDWSWGAVYKNIRNINIAIANLDQVPFKTEAEKNRAKADAYFLRGFSYYLLMAQFGGVVLYEQPVVLGEDYVKTRNTFEETVNFIIADLDKAISLYDPTEIGTKKTRADKGAAMAVKAKVLLYAASDLHNSAKNNAITSGYSNPELLGYTGGDAAARWQAARDAAKAVIDLNKYHLYTGNSDKVRNFEEIFINRSDEDIFLRYLDKNIDWYWQVGRTPFYEGSPGYGGWGVNSVLGNVVDAFEMSDGSKFDWNNLAHKANPFVNRDPRLYASVLMEGADWHPRPATANKIRVGKWPVGTDPATAPDALRSNYFLRKFSDLAKGPASYDDFEKCPPWSRVRYAEVLLNYAEACIELGQDAEARTYINMIRERAGMPPVTESGAALKERYRNERRVELAFEDHRFFDVRRWLNGPESSVDGYGLEVLYPVPGSFDNPTFNTVVVDPGRTWVNKAYFLPITTDELNKNTALIQNPGY